ncbi:MAG: isoleucine--tRNA ligase [Myxococcota bacterium]
MSDAPAKDYKDTLNLPQTGFPMKGNLAQLEPRLIAHWLESRTFERVLEKNRGRPAFTLHDGPPYANGRLHAGHALNKVLKDIVVKYRNLAGARADFIPGWDCHGLPIEQAVEKKLREQKVDRRTLSREDFLARCRAYALEFIELQQAEFQRLGVFARWDAKYRTLDFAYEAQELRELAKFAAAGSLSRRNRPVFWCVYDQTALALAEIEYEDLQVPSTYVAFPAASDLSAKWSFLAGKRVEFAIWTTTPWTLAANRAICVHPDFEYVFYELTPGRVLVVAKELLAKTLSDCAPGELTVRDVKLGEGSFDAAVFASPLKVLGYARGEELAGLTYRHVFLDRVSPVLTGTHVTLEAGTGLVHTAPGHGPDDYEVGLRAGLEIDNPVKADGRYDDSVGPLLAGQFVFDANETVPRLLHERGALLNQPGEFITTSYPHSWRSKKPVIYRATPQWFISMEHGELRQKALAQIASQVRWVPAWGRDRIEGMLATRPDWTLSRQRTWGVPIPTAVCSACQHALIDARVMNAVADAVAKEGGGAWYARPLSDFRPEGARCPSCGADALVKETDILDVWFDSACSFAAVLEPQGARVPVDLYLEGSDQHRGWFHSSLLVAVGTRGVAPYRTCLTHGFVVDGQGKKMSKSLGNTVSPDDIIKRYGAEVLRLWVASADYRDDVRLSFSILDGLSEGYRKIRNTVRFALANLFDFDPARDAVEELQPLEQWVLGKHAALVDRVTRAYEAYEFHVVFQAVVDFCANELSAQYFDIQKDTLYTARKDGAKRRSAQTALYRLAKDLLVLLAPVMSFTAEEAYGFLPGAKRDSVFLEDLPAPTPFATGEHDALFRVRAEVLPALEVARREKRIGKSLEAQVTVSATGATLELLRRHHDVLPELFIVSQVTVREGTEPPKVELAAGHKCPRCWAWRPEVGAQELCARCTEAVG